VLEERQESGSRRLPRRFPLEPTFLSHFHSIDLGKYFVAFKFNGDSSGRSNDDLNDDSPHEVPGDSQDFPSGGYAFHASFDNDMAAAIQDAESDPKTLKEGDFSPIGPAGGGDG
jgi:hypothetical protein